NLLPHELLFGQAATVRGASPERIWRLAPDTYDSFIRGLHRGQIHGIIQPFSLGGERGIRDYADLHTIDEPTTELLLRNAAIVVQVQTGYGASEKE
ncbi:hypothetical protein ABTM99_19215, partial [Acinetobacter baumannii]